MNQSNNRFKHIDFMLVDLLSLHFAFVLSYFIRFQDVVNPYAIEEYRTISAVLSLILIVSILVTDNHKKILRRGLFDELTGVILLSFITLALTTLYMYAAYIGVIYSRLLLLFTAIIFILIDWIFRNLLKVIIRKRLSKSRSNRNKRSVFLVTDSDNKDRILSDINSDFYSHFSVCGMLMTDGVVDSADETSFSSAPQALHHICRQWIDEVIVCTSSQTEEINNFISTCAEMGVTVHSVIPIQNTDRNRQVVEEIAGRSVLTTSINRVTLFQSAVKRLFDIIGGLLGYIVTLFLALVIGPLIKKNSPGPILFKQERIGKNGKKFKLLKFRSMYLDAEDRKKDLMAQNRVSDGMMFKLDFDPRIIGNEILPDGSHKTGIGEFIRKTSLDEFPQFFNVLKGEMSLVGTRPPTVDEWEKYEYHHRARLAMKPGITGLWQVSGRSEITDFEEVVKLDTEYISNFRLSLDLKILFKTVSVIFNHNGAM